MKNAIKLTNVSKLFTAEAGEPCLVLDGISLSIAEGSLSVIGGANGSGKSVLMAIIAGLRKATEGDIELASQPGLVFQDAATQLLGDTPREDVAVGPRNLGRKKAEIAEIAERSLQAVSLLAKADYPAEFLSGGEKRRLAVASILAMQRDIIIFDEPYANLDYPGVLEVNALIEKLHGEGKTILLLTHELEKCLGMADHFLILQKGRLVFDGRPEEALAQPLEQWGIKNPLCTYRTVTDLVWRA